MNVRIKVGGGRVGFLTSLAMTLDEVGRVLGILEFVAAHDDGDASALALLF